MQRRRLHRSTMLAAMFIVIGLALGASLPQSETVSFLLLAVAAALLVLLLVREDSRAPYHGLHHAIHLPAGTSVAATFDSFRSRVVGTVRAGFDRPQKMVEVVEPDDDEAEAWWGATPELAASAAPAADPA